MLAGQFDELKDDLTCVRILKVRHYYVDFYTMISLMQYRASVGLHNKGAILVDFVVYVLFGDDTCLYFRDKYVCGK